MRYTDIVSFSLHAGTFEPQCITISYRRRWELSLLALPSLQQLRIWAKLLPVRLGDPEALLRA